MNANRIVSMVINMIMRRLLRSGVDAGMNAVGKRMNKGKTDAEIGKSPDSRHATKRMKQSMRITRKIGRF